ncbi:MAG: hypothetical protein LBJ00_12175 [Planctomycetaceae bacterium]|jgi:tetratricopeptide (TPR) repeat protein|nr:hypothetical protein [Planctomycetaceae bacterium]
MLVRAFFLFFAFLSVVFVFAGYLSAQNKNEPIPDTILMLAEGPSERKQLEDLYYQFLQIPENERKTKGYELIKNNITKFKSQKLIDHFNLHLGLLNEEKGLDKESELFFSRLSDVSPLQCSLRVPKLLAKKKYEETIKLISDCINNPSYTVTGEMRAEFETQRLFASVKANKNVDVIAECERILARKDGSRRESLSRFQRLASDFENEKPDLCLKIMEWLELKMDASEMTANFLNNFAFHYEHAGDMENSIKKREKMIELFPNDPITLSHIRMLVGILMRRNQENDYANIEVLLKKALSHPHLSEKQRKSSQELLELVENVKRGRVAAPRWSNEAPETYKGQEKQFNDVSIYVRICLMVVGIMLIIMSLFLKIKKWIN